jgi:hypothetical protein
MLIHRISRPRRDLRYLENIGRSDGLSFSDWLFSDGEMLERYPRYLDSGYFGSRVSELSEQLDLLRHASVGIDLPLFRGRK